MKPRTIALASAAALAASVVLLKRILKPPADRPLLLSLPYSHYVEIGRWSLQRSGREFRELKMPVGPHMLTSVYRLLFPGGVSSTSSFPGDSEAQSRRKSNSLVHRLCASMPAVARQLMGVPALVVTDAQTNETSVVPDSWSILESTGLSVEPSTKRRLDSALGPAVRRLAYAEVFGSNFAFYRAIQSGGPFFTLWFELNQFLFQTHRIMIGLMDLSPEGSADARRIVAGEFAAVEEVLAAHSFLGEGRGAAAFGGADLAFSALAGWIVLPPNMHNGAIDPSLLDVEHFKNCPNLLSAREELQRDYPRAWALVVKCYATERCANQ